MDLITEFAAILDALQGANIEYAVCGGFAVNIYGHVRTTRDVDLLLREEELDRARSVLASIGFKFESGRIPFGFGTPHHRELLRVSKLQGQAFLVVDLMLVTPVFEQVWADRETAEWNGRQISLVSLSGLIFMKRLAGRAQDLADLEKLGELHDE